MAIVFARCRLGALGALAALAVLGLAPAANASGATRSCAPVLRGFMHCDALAKPASPKVARAATATPYGYGPSDLQSAYALAGKAASLGGDQTVAIVDAYHDPTAESDLATYRAQYGLPPCSAANGCFQQLDQDGGTNYPAVDTHTVPNWATETSLDLDMVSAVCPECHILLVEANSDSEAALFTAVDTAAAHGATQISNSWGGSEDPSETLAESHFNHGIPITVSSGDSGYGTEYPAASAFVTAVGGTTLEPSANARGWNETAWSLAGSGCSQYIPKPAWQHDTSCATRTVADISAVADPDTGVATYSHGMGWQVFGGTSAAAPIVAAAYALIGSAASGPGFAYANPTWFNDVTSGSNGTCDGSYLCNAVTGFDGPTGIGTPNLGQPGVPSSPVSGGGGTTTPPPVNPAPPAPVPSPPVQPLVSSVAVASASATASRSGRITVRLTCAAGRPRCSGRLKLQLARSGGRVITLGWRSYSIAPGARAYLSVRLSRYGLSQLRKHHRLRLYGTALDSDGTAAQSSFMARAPKPKRRVKHRRRH